MCNRVNLQEMKFAKKKNLQEWNLLGMDFVRNAYFPAY